MKRFVSTRENKIIGMGKLFDVVVGEASDLPVAGELVEINGSQYKVNEVQITLLTVKPPKRSPVVTLFVTDFIGNKS